MSGRMMPRQKPGLSRQDFATPKGFIATVEKRFGKLEVDLAATARNAKAPRYVTPKEDSFSVEWQTEFDGMVCWLNPPFGNIGPWAEKCAAEGPYMGNGGVILFLTPASIGANWFARYVYRNALVIGLQGRLSFDGKNPYPKDLLSVFGPGVPPGFEVWDWEATRT
jgi:phage N-6-adenine-methyltransferase